MTVKSAEGHFQDAIEHFQPAVERFKEVQWLVCYSPTTAGFQPLPHVLQPYGMVDETFSICSLPICYLV